MSSLHLSTIVPPPPNADDIIYLGFNQDNSCMAAGVSNGFRIFNSDPYKETFKREFSGGIAIVEMLFRCNILALVGGGKNPAFEPNKVILWDDNQSTPIGELTFKSDVKAVKLRRDKIVVVLEKHVYLYNFDKLERINKFNTNVNKKGLVALSPNEQCVLAFPHTSKGIVKVELLDQNSSHLINAHDNNLNCMALNADGSRLATASEKGTLIRIFDTISGNKLQEVRRGADRAAIYSINFSHDSAFFCTSSDKGTVHIFSSAKNVINGGSSYVEQEEEKTKEAIDSANRKSKLSLFGGYFSSEWSFAWFKGPECPSICCFGQDNKSVIVYNAAGSYFRVSFDTKKGGEGICKEKKNFFQAN